MTQQHVTVLKQNYSTLSEIYAANIKDENYRNLLFTGCVIFYILQKVGELTHSIVVKDKVKNKVSKELFGTYLQSVVHVVMVSVCSCIILFKFAHRTDEIEVIDHNDDDYFYIVLYRISSVLSTSYFIVMTPYELFIIPQPSVFFRIVISIHHIICIMAQSLVFVTNPISVFISAMGLQCEFSTLFLNIRMFGFVMNNKYIFFVGGLGTLIFYPLTRIILFVGTIYKTYGFMDKIVLYFGTDAFYLVLFSQLFVLVMSSVYFFSQMLSNPSKIMILHDSNDADKIKQG